LVLPELEDGEWVYLSEEQKQLAQNKQENALRISLETQSNNHESHRLYEQMGFIRDSEFQTLALQIRLLYRLAV
jgi:RimJ/RimL family protein N-acetyltransferase